MNIKGKKYLQPGARVRFLDPVGPEKIVTVEGTFKGYINITLRNGRLIAVHKKFLRHI